MHISMQPFEFDANLGAKTDAGGMPIGLARPVGPSKVNGFREHRTCTSFGSL